MLWHPLRNVIVLIWHPVRNIGILVWHPVRNIGILVWHPVRNIARLIWHPIRNLGLMIWSPVRNVLNAVWNSVLVLAKPFLSFMSAVWFRASQIPLIATAILKAKKLLMRFGPLRGVFVRPLPVGQSNQSSAYVDSVERNILVLFLCVPAALLFAAKNTWVAKMFFQHEPREWVSKDLPKLFEPDKQYPQITIVTPSYGQAEFIERTMDSVIDQGYPNLNYWVQDGCSSDGTVEILQKYSEKLSGWQSVSDNGQTHALNLALEQVEVGEIMAYLNSDDLFLQDSFAKIVNYFQENPNVDVIYGNRVMIDENDLCIGSWVLHGHNSAVLSYADYVPQETMFWRRSIWEKAGGKFDESFRFAMDWDLLLRFRSAGASFLHVPEFLGAFRIHSAQKTQAMINEVGEGEMARLRQRELGFVPSDVDVYSNILPFLLRHTIADFKLRYINKLI